MVNTTSITTTRGTRLPQSLAMAYERPWKHRPSAVFVGGFAVADNSTGVSAARCRPR
jgi:hypothetical protein